MKLPFAFQPGEEMLLLARRHWLFVWPKLAAGGLAALLPVGILWYALARFDLAHGSGKQWAAAMGALVWLAYWGARLYFFKYRYDNDIWLVTNQRLIDSVKRHWFHHQMSSTDLVDIEDITMRRAGFLGTVFNFGDIECQTAGAQRNFSVRGIPHPAEFLTFVDRQRDEARAGAQE